MNQAQIVDSHRELFQRLFSGVRLLESPRAFRGWIWRQLEDGVVSNGIRNLLDEENFEVLMYPSERNSITCVSYAILAGMASESGLIAGIKKPHLVLRKTPDDLIVQNKCAVPHASVLLTKKWFTNVEFDNDNSANPLVSMDLSTMRRLRSREESYEYASSLGYSELDNISGVDGLSALNTDAIVYPVTSFWLSKATFDDSIYSLVCDTHSTLSNYFDLRQQLRRS